MDIMAHVLWAGAATVLVTRRRQVPRRTVVATLALAGLPDVLQFVPVLAWVLFGDGAWSALGALATSMPGHEPPMPDAVGLASHHLHCMGHSAVIAAVMTAALWIARGSLWMPLLGWWSHIVIDVFTHSAAFYPSPALYPLTYRGFDGVAWNEPWLLWLNYGALGVFFAWAIVRVCVRRPGRVARKG